MKLNMKSRKVTKSLCAVFLALGVMFSPFVKPIFATETIEDELIDEWIDEPIEEETTTVETTTAETTTAETTTVETTTAETTTAETTTAETTTVETTTTEDSELILEEGDSSEGIVYKYNVTIEFGALHFYYDWGEWNTNTHSYQADPSSTNPAADTVAGTPGWYGFDGQNNLLTIKNHSDGEVLVNVTFDMNKDGKYDNSSGEFRELNHNIIMSLYESVENTIFGTKYDGEVHTNSYNIRILFPLA